MSGRTSNPYASLRYYRGAELARATCPEWRMVSAHLDATLPGRAWPKEQFAPGWTPPPAGVRGDGPPAWCELDHTGASTWHEGQPPAPVGIVCDRDWRPVEVRTDSGRVLPRLDAPKERLE